MTHEASARARVAVPVLALVAGAAVSVALGAYGSVHQPSGRSITTFGFGNLIAMKVWLASAAGGLAVAQLLTALRM